MDADKVLVAMSGGVDSSVAAWLVQESGAECAGAMMLLCGSKVFCDLQDDRDARQVAARLALPFYSLDTRDEFCRDVVEDFIRIYEEGHTPNPCILCNQRIKFGWFMDKARELGYEAVATGHYARIERNEDGRYLLKKAADPGKDQSYFLACLTQEQLSRSRFPLGELTKDQVRSIALEQGFVTAKKRDSQDVCFIPDGDYKAFMERYTGKTYPAGDYLDQCGKALGKHAGAVGYTIGQRKGLGIALGAPAYVCSKDMVRNTVTLGSNADLFSRELVADQWNWIAIDGIREPLRCLARVRYRHTEQPATVYPDGRVIFDEPQRAITTGQTLVLYEGDTVIAGARIIAVK